MNKISTRFGSPSFPNSVPRHSQKGDNPLLNLVPESDKVSGTPTSANCILMTEGQNENTHLYDKYI